MNDLDHLFGMVRGNMEIDGELQSLLGHRRYAWILRMMDPRVTELQPSFALKKMALK